MIPKKIFNPKNFILLLFLSFTQIMWAQIYPIKVTVAVTPPYPTYISDYVDEAGKTLLILQNTDFTKSFKVKFSARIEGDNGIKIILKQNIDPQYPLVLEPGEVKTLTGDELKDMYGNVDFEDLVYSGPNIQDVIQSQKIPEGNYVGCVTVIDINTDEQLSADPPLGCSPIFGILALDAPIITSPLEGTSLIAQNVQQLLFNWTNVAGAQLPISYKWRMAILPDNVNPYDAMASNNLLVWEEEDIPSPVFLYGPQFPPLNVGQRYAVQVQAYDATGNTLIANDGWSEVVTFNYIEPLFFPVLDTLPDLDIPVVLDTLPDIVIPDSTVSTPPLVAEVFNCGDACADAQINNNNDIASINRGDVVLMGHFRMEMTQFSIQNNRYTGTGMIEANDFCPLPIRVSFNNIRVNNERQVFSGTAKAMKNADYFDFDLIDENAEFTHFNSVQNLQNLYDKLMTIDQGISTYISDSFDPQYELGAVLPLGYGEGDGLNQNSMHIVDMRFTPLNAEIAVVNVHELPAALDLDGATQYLALGADHVCFTPGGPASGEDNTRLKLLKEITYKTSDKFTLHISKADPGSETGTFGHYNCDGFQDMHLGGFVTFPRDYIVPARANGTIFNTGKLAASFETFVDDDLNWMTDLDFTPNNELGNNRATNYFKFVGLDDFLFNLRDVKIDFSDVTNVPDMVFPVGYNAHDDWKGVFIKNGTIKLPDYITKNDDERVTVNASNILIDDRGLSIKTNAHNLVPKNGNTKIGGWGFSIKDFDIEIAENDFEASSMNGSFKLPISNSWIDYEAGYGNDKFEFNISPVDELNVEIWKAKMRIDESSEFGLNIVDGNAELLVSLNGNLSLADEIEGVEGVDIKNINFNNLRIENKAPFISGMTFNLDPNMNTSFAGFKVGINNIGFDPNIENIAGQEFKMPLILDLDFTFGPEGGNSFGGGSKITLNAVKGVNAIEWNYAGLDIKRININAEVSSTSISGAVDFYKNDAVFGDGFRGQLRASFFGDFSIDAEALFGHKNNYDYWYVAGNAKFTPAVPIVGPMAFNGFGGGAYYNMRNVNALNINQLGTNSKPSYEPRRNGWGFLATACFVSMPSEKLFNGDVTLSVAFQNGGGLRSINLNGDSNLMREPTISNGVSSGGTEEQIKLRGDILYDNINKIFHAELGYRLRIPAGSPFINTDRLDHRVVAFHVEGLNNWYLHLGKPNAAGNFNDMIAIEAHKTLNILGHHPSVELGLYTYFDLGYNMPPFPPLPQKVLNIFGQHARRYDPRVNPRSGVAAGFHADFSIPRFTFSVGYGWFSKDVGFDAGAGFGFDVAIRNNAGILCNNNANYGINNYYALGQGYVFGYAHFYAFGTSVGAEFAAAVNAELPNPTYVSGRIGINVEIGPLDFRFNKGFSIGNRCDFSEDEDVNDDRVESYIRDLDLITSMNPEDNLDDLVDLTENLQAQVSFITTPNRSNSVEIGNSTMYYKVGTSNYLKIKGPNGYTSAGFIRKSTSDNTTTFFLNKKASNGRRALLADTEYRFEVKATLYYREDSSRPWLRMRDEDNNLKIESRSFDFRTGPVASVINEVTDQTIKPNQNYFHKGDYAGGSIKYPNPGIFDRYQVGGFKVVKFTDLESGTSINTPFTVNTQSNYEVINFNIDDLEPSKTYKMEVIAGHNNNPLHPTIAYTCYFGTSRYNTLLEKVNALNVLNHTSSGDAINNRYYTISFVGPEKFDAFEKVHGPSFIVMPNNNNNWFITRHSLEELGLYYQEHGSINMDNIIEDVEMVMDPTLLTPPLNPDQLGQGNFNPEPIVANNNFFNLGNVNGFNNVNNIQFACLKIKYQPDVRIFELRRALFVEIFLDRANNPMMWDFIQSTMNLGLMPQTGSRKFKLYIGEGGHFHSFKNFNF